MSTARIKLPHSLERLLRSEMESAISEANLGREGTVIARRYLIEQIPQIDIAAEFGCERSTISRRMPEMISRIEQAAKKLNHHT